MVEYNDSKLFDLILVDVKFVNNALLIVALLIKLLPLVVYTENEL